MEGRCAELYPKEVSCSKIDAIEEVVGFSGSDGFTQL